MLLAATASHLVHVPPASADPNGSIASCSYSLPKNPEPNPGISDEVRDFAQAWFDGLSNRAPADEMLGFLNLHSLVMSFPGPGPGPDAESVCDEASFREWYDKAGARYADQHHDILSFDVGGTDDLPIVHSSVAWSGKDAQTGQPFSYTLDQAWSLARGGPHGFVIEAYLVSGLAPA
ncbi:MAG: hypothetical protein ACRC20_03790 [Segniliparus sp.]|uniref:hypothetical protein n=1 Tax=Segniliparus sp. TaxID=2804064 RepID=UPI003F411F9E